MARIVWDEVGNRHYQIGVDRTVLYVDGYEGVAWNGITGIDEAPIGGTQTPYYMDGVKYLSVTALEEYAATIKALSTPELFGLCDGTVSVHRGLFATHQPRKPFGLTYRTLVGNDTEGSDYGYQIHLVYNATANPSTRANNTVSRTPTPVALSYPIEAIPERPFGVRPTAHLVVDSRDSNKMALAYLEAILYGTLDTSPRLPTVSELQDIFGWDLPEYDGPINIRGMWDSAEKTITNLYTRPSFESESGKVVRRRNLHKRPTATADWLSYAGVSGAGTTTYLTGSGHPQVDTFARLTITTSPSSGGSAGLLTRSDDALVVPGGSYAFRISHRNNQSANVTDIRMEVKWFLGTTQVGAADFVDSTIQGADVWHHMSNVFVAPSGVDRVQVTSVAIYSAPLPVGTTLDATAAMVCPSTVMTDYFDGSTPQQRAKSYEWEGTPNASTSIEYTPTMVEIAKNLFTNPRLMGDGTYAEVGRNLFTNPRLVGDGTWAEVRRNLVKNPSFETDTAGWQGARSILSVDSSRSKFGASSVKITITDASSTPYIISTVVDRVPVIGGEVLPVSSWVFPHPNTVSASMQVYEYDSSGVLLTPVLTTPMNSVLQGQWNEVSGTVTTKPNAATARVVVIPNSALPVGGEWWVDGIMVGSSGPYFDGTTPDFSVDPDMRQRWLGTPNASESVMEIERVRGFSTNAAIAGVSAWEGKPAMRIIPTHTVSNQSVARITIPAAARPMGTVIGTLHMPQPLTGTLWDRRGTLYARNPLTISTPAAPNVAGTTDIRLQFADQASGSVVDFVNGARLNGGDVWWTDIALFAGDYRYPWNGSPDDLSGIAQPEDFRTRWTGTADNSELVLEGEKVTGLGGTRSHVIVSTKDGKPAARLIPSGGTLGQSCYAWFGIPVAARSGGTLLGTVHSIVEAPHYHSSSRRLAAQAPWAESSEQGPASGSATIRYVYGALTSVNQAILYGNGASQGNGDVWWTDIGLFAGQIDNRIPGFDGDTIPDDIDWTCWRNEDGTSSIGGVAVPGVTNSVNSVTIRSSRWSAQGAYSARNIPTSQFVEAYFQVASPVSWRSAGVAVVILHLETPQTGHLIGTARSIQSYLPSVYSPTTPNITGDYIIRIEHQGANGSNVNLINGARLNGGDVWWDLATIVADDYDGPPISGETLLRWQQQYLQADWTGTPHNSTSEFTYLLTPPPITTYGDAYIVNGNLWVLNSEMLWQNLGDDLPPLT